MRWYIDVMKNYADFNGRARRREYWFFNLVNVSILVVLFIIEAALGIASEDRGIGPLSGLYALIVLVPGLAVTVRRLHDTGRSGWWVLVGIVPFLGALVLLVLTLLDSQPGTNEFGPNPKAVRA